MLSITQRPRERKGRPTCFGARSASGQGVTIVCPTHGRPGQLHAFKCFGEDPLLSLAESQVPACHDAYPDARIDPHPESIVRLPARGGRRESGSRMTTHRTWDRVMKSEQRVKDAFGSAIRRRGDTDRSSSKVEIQLQLDVPW